MREDSLIDKMLKRQAFLQREAYGHQLKLMTDEQKMEWVRNNVLALTDELHEVLGCTGWKPWATSNHLNVEQFKGEMVDAWHFFMNLMLVAGMTGDDLWNGYIEKSQRNYERQQNGYDGITGKCPQCKKALDDPGVDCYYDPLELTGYCATNGLWKAPL